MYAFTFCSFFCWFINILGLFLHMFCVKDGWLINGKKLLRGLWLNLTWWLRTNHKISRKCNFRVPTGFGKLYIFAEWFFCCCWINNKSILIANNNRRTWGFIGSFTFKKVDDTEQWSIGRWQDVMREVWEDLSYRVAPTLKNLGVFFIKTKNFISIIIIIKILFLLLS